MYFRLRNTRIVPNKCIEGNFFSNLLGEKKGGFFGLIGEKSIGETFFQFLISNLFIYSEV
jgi:hypothetical protein